MMRWPFMNPSACQSLVLLISFFLLINVEKAECLGYVSNSSLGSRAYEWGFLGGYPRQSFKSSSLRPPRMNLVQWDEQCGQGYTLLTLRGTSVSKPTAVIMDGTGELVWMDESFGYIMNLKIQRYKGQQYLTFWSGAFGEGFGKGTYYMLDLHYQIYKQFSTAGIRDSDFHEYTITDDNTALLTTYNIAPADLSSLGVKGEGWIYDSMFQEIDIDTGELLFEWRASDHFAINETNFPIGSTGQTPEHPFDFFHINSIDKDEAGNYVISSRFMHSVSCISAKTGEILWTLGGSHNQFTDISDGRATDFRWQHHATLQKDGTISIFDNAKYMKWHEELWDHGEISRGMLISLDTDNMTAELVQEFVNPTMRGVPQQGSVQILEESDTALVGWGYHGAFTEYSLETGEVLCDTHINPSITFNFGFVHSYRAFRATTWVGKPKTQPAVSLRPRDGRAYVSWMGSTEVDHWVLQTADETPTDDLKFTDAAIAVKDGFETSLEVPRGTFKYLRVTAMDREGQILATTKTISANKNTASSGHVFAILAGLIFGCGLFLALICHKGLRRCFKAGKERWQSKSWPFRRGSRSMGQGKATKFELEALYDEDRNFL